jgi:hypothetical protein
MARSRNVAAFAFTYPKAFPWYYDLSEFKTKDAAMAGDSNSKRTRVLPIFRWFKENGGTWWPSRLLQISHGFASGLILLRVLLDELSSSGRCGEAGTSVGVFSPG